MKCVTISNQTSHLKTPYTTVLTSESLQFLTDLHREFNERRKQLLHKRIIRQQQLDQGIKPTFLDETAHIRNSEWTVAPLPKDLLDRRVEITGPVDRKMVINALNSGAKVFMADFEDSTSPTWDNVMQGQINLRDAVNRTIQFEGDNGKKYELGSTVATLMVRPRGWHLEEKHLQIDGENMSGSLVDFGLYFFHNAKTLLENGSGPYFYLPKLENHLEARLWNDVFLYAQEYMGIPSGTIKATVLLETILAAFEMDEILYELKEHSAGLNCGRWDYIFSYLKKLRNYDTSILPDRSLVTMTSPFMRAYSLLVIQTCHRRGVHAMGGMAAQIPIKGDEEANKAAFEKVRLDKEREAKDGHDGTWVAHPGLVSVAMDVFNEHMKDDNQIARPLMEMEVSQEDLLLAPKGPITEQGIRMNINAAIQYIESWLSGRGAAPIFHLMEDAATAEISRAQIWQWIHHPAGKTDENRKVTLQWVRELQMEELEKIKQLVGEERFKNGRFEEAARLFEDLVGSNEFAEFLTLKAYEILEA